MSHTNSTPSPSPAARVVRGEYRGIAYRVASRHPYSGIGWTLLWGDGSSEHSSGAFYDDCSDHPEGAFAWAESSVRRRIDKIHETLDTYVPAHLRLDRP
jgi:hypothetical protein